MPQVNLQAKDISRNPNWAKVIEEYKRATGKDISDDLTRSLSTHAEQNVLRRNAATNPYPVAKGPSTHETGNAIDVESPLAKNKLFRQIAAKYDLIRPLPVTDPIHFQNKYPMPDANMPQQLREQIGGQAFNKVPDTLKRVKESLAKQPKVAEKPAEPGFWEKFKNSSFGLGKSAAMTDINPPETFKRDVASVNKTPPSGQAFREPLNKRSNMFSGGQESPAIAAEPTKSPVTETPTVAADIPPMGESAPLGESAPILSRKSGSLNLGAKAGIPPPVDSSLGSTVKTMLTKNDPYKNTVSPVVPEGSVKDGIATLHSAENDLSTTDTSAAEASLRGAAGEEKKALEAKYGPKYAAYIASVEGAKGKSREGLSSQYKDYLASLDANKKAEFWQKMIQSFGQLAAGGMNMMTKTRDGVEVPRFGDVAGAYKPIDVYNRATDDASAQAKFKAMEAQNQMDKEDTLSGLETAEKARVEQETGPSNIQAKLLNAIGTMKEKNAPKLGQKQGTTQQQVPVPSLGAAGANKSVELISDPEAKKTADAAAAEIKKSGILERVNSASVRDKRDFLELTRLLPSHAGNLGKAYDTIAARDGSKTPSQIAFTAITEYAQALSTMNPEAARELGANINVILQPKRSTQAELTGAPAAPSSSKISEDAVMKRVLENRAAGKR